MRINTEPYRTPGDKLKIVGKSQSIALRMKPHTDLDDTELLQKMLAGDEEAMTTLYRRRQGGIYRFAIQMCGSRVLAEDVTQEVFIVLIRDAQIFDPARGSLNSFLVGVARNLLLQRLRRERFYAPLEEDAAKQPTTYNSSNAEPLEDLSRTEAIRSLRTAVLALPTRYREVVVLCDLQEMSYAEAAEVLGCVVGTVRSRLHRGRALLIEKLRPAQEEQPAAAAAKSTRCFA